MLKRPQYTALTQHQPQRSASHGQNTQAHNSNSALSRLSQVRSISGSHEVVELDEEDLRPQKRARIEDIEIIASPEQLDDELHHVVPGESLGMPIRPANDNNNDKNIKRATRSVENAARKSNGLLPPAMAVKLPHSKTVADFSPWTGMHPEDVLNEQVIKNGYSEKGPSLNQNDSNTARPMIWPTLSQKNNVALHTLSSLYTQVLEKRQTLGRCTAPSTFKPPPRVTVTDTKREAWLKDLANPAVSLRRQSRTIPHGIRGKLLLDQCVTKAIPLQRAVWLAKCVGANELRAFRRKGVTGPAMAQGEAKWIRDWTVSVEQFMDEAIRASAQQDWRTRLEYAVKLITAIYMEGLLESDHFLDYVVSRVTTSNLDHLPSWMILVHIHWQELVTSGRRGRLLARALISHLQASTAHAALQKRLGIQITSMLLRSRWCLILPDIWQQSRSLISELCTNAEMQTIFSSIDARNMHLMQPNTAACKARGHPLTRLYEKLDHVGVHLNLEQLVNDSLSVIPDISALTSALLSWASTGYRFGDARVVLVENMIVSLRQRQHDTDAAIMSFLATNSTADIRADNIYTIIVQLVHRGSFSAGRYLKWLITSYSTSMTLARGLLVNLPDDYLPRHLQNTRASLLSRLQTVDQHRDIEAVKVQIEECLAKDSSLKLDTNISFSARLQLVDWVRNKTISLSKTGLSLLAFNTLRNVFEACNNQSLGTLLSSAVLTDDFLLLGTVADTINVNALQLAVASQLQELTDKVFARYRVLRTQQPLERTSMCALQNLYRRLDHKAAIKLLKNDLVMYERQNMSAVCSPASDNLVGMQAGSIDNDEEIEAVFASGNTMDEHLMRRVFQRIMQRSNKSSTPTTTSAPCRWLSHLRLLDQSAFEKIVSTYLIDLFSTHDSPILPSGVYALVTADCCSLDKVSSFVSSTKGAALFTRLVAMALPTTIVLSNTEQHHFRQLQITYHREHVDRMEELLERAAESLRPNDAEWLAKLMLPCGRVHKLPSTLYEAMLALYDQKVTSAAEVINQANSLNYALCAGWLQSHSDKDASSAIIDAIKKNNPAWSSLLQSCDGTVMKEVYNWAMETLLQDPDEHTTMIDVLDITHAVQPPDSNLMTTLAARFKVLQKSILTSGTQEHIAQIELLLHITVLSTKTTEVNTQGRAYIALALCSILSTKLIEAHPLAERITDITSMLVDKLPQEIISRMIRSAQTAALSEQAITACFGKTQTKDWLVLASTPSTKLVQKSTAVRKAPIKPEIKYTPFTLRRWEVMQDPTPVIAENDTSINLALFGARKVL